MPPSQKNSLGLLGLLVFAIISLGIGAYYRFPALNDRPMHTDEAILAMKFADFQQSGHFKYDPKDFHGPGLHYVTQLWSRLAGWGDSLSWTEAQLRTVPAVCGLLLISLTLLLRDALGRLGTGLAMLIMSVSPMMVYYSRYFIMEMPLALFVTLTIAALWRWSQGGGFWWLVVAGFSLGLQHATKETFVLNVAAGVIGFAMAKLVVGDFAPKPTGFSMGSASSRDAKAAWLWVALAALLTSVTLYSGFFKDWQAVKDSVTTYLNYLERSGGSGHEKPWHYYLTLIFWRKDGLTWSEGMIGGLGIVGMLYSFLGNHQKSASRQAFLVFLSTYTIALFGIYSFLAYKTPWSILCAQHSLTLLAGVGAAAIFAAVRGRLAGLLLKILFGFGLYHLVSQTSFAIHLYAADQRNPYVYSHTTRDIFRLVSSIRDLQKTAPDGAFDVLVVNRDHGWPLPWYLRDVPSVRFVSDIPATIDARVIVAESGMQPALQAKLSDKSYQRHPLYGLRPGVFLDLWVEPALWERHSLRKQQEATRQ